MKSKVNIDHFRIRMEDLGEVFATDDRELLENLGNAAAAVTRQYFGRAISLYAPLYISNFCRNRCVYCGFHAGRTRVKRRKLTMVEIGRECEALAATGIRSCLLLTGESRFRSPPSYIGDAVAVAGEYFPNVALEVYALETEEYRSLYRAGADGVTMFQETYDRDRYRELHPAGPKRDYDYRYDAPARMAEAGFRHIGMGPLLGLTDWRKEVPMFFAHVRDLERRYPGVEYTLSFPRLRPVASDEGKYFGVNDRDMVKIISVGRLLFPRAGINLSTREAPIFRDRILEFGITKMSAGSLTSVGGYGDAEKAQGDGQFEVHDPRSLAEIKKMLIGKGYDPVVTDWRNIVNF